MVFKKNMPVLMKAKAYVIAVLIHVGKRGSFPVEVKRRKFALDECSKLRGIYPERFNFIGFRYKSRLKSMSDASVPTFYFSVLSGYNYSQ
jgi:hypothetical protein